MLCALLAFRHGAAAAAAATGSALQPSAVCFQLLGALQAAVHSSSSLSSNVTPAVSPSDLIPKSTSNRDRVLTSSQLESLAIYKRFNISQPNLRGQVILAKVLRTTSRQVLVDPGYYGLNWVSKQELASAAGYTANGEPISRSSPEILPGDYVKVRLSFYNTPYGDAQLDPVGVPQEVRSKLVWDEIERRMKAGKMVHGRILNPTVKGYAVGVAGYVALLEHGHALPEMAAQIGTLQPFYVASMDRGRRQIKLSAVKLGSMEESYRKSL